MAQQIHIFGIEIAKLVFHIVGMDDTGHGVLRKRVARNELLAEEVAQLIIRMAEKNPTYT
jgi:hypothetical protein